MATLLYCAGAFCGARKPIRAAPDGAQGGISGYFAETEMARAASSPSFSESTSNPQPGTPRRTAIFPPEIRNTGELFKSEAKRS